MKRVLFIFATISCLMLLAGCKDPGDNGGGGDALWKHAAPLVDKVEVYAGDFLLETYQYTYDESGRLASLVRTDNAQKTELLNLTCTYGENGTMKAAGKFYPIATNRFITVTRDSRTVTYTGSWSGALTYTTTVDENGTAVSTAASSNFAAAEGRYVSDMEYSEQYTVKDGCITTAVKGSAVKTQSQRATRAESSSALTVNFTYGNDADRQNFAVYLMDCDFPVWCAAGLPGCKKLITGISYAAGQAGFPVSVKIDYSLNASGDIQTATRTDYNGTETVLVRTYIFSYL